MKRTLLSAIMAIVIIGTSATASSAQDQVGQLVLQLQKAPADTALREKIIKLAVTMKPAPEIPEDARRPFIRGNTAIKNASSPDDYANAIKLYQEALLRAPWWADAYFNLAKGQELHQEYDAAIQSLKFFLMTSPSAADAREAQDHIYALEELRDKKSVADKRKIEDEKGKPESLVGDWDVIESSGMFAPDAAWVFYRLKRSTEDEISFSRVLKKDDKSTGQTAGGEFLQFKLRISGGHLTGTHDGDARFAVTCNVEKGGEQITCNEIFTPIPTHGPSRYVLRKR